MTKQTGWRVATVLALIGLIYLGVKTFSDDGGTRSLTSAGQRDPEAPPTPGTTGTLAPSDVRVVVPVDQMVAVAQIAGHVVDRAGAACTGAQLTLEQLDGMAVGQALVSGPEGEFRWEHLAQRAYRLRAAHAGVIAERVVVAPDDEVILRLSDMPEDADVALRVAVLDRFGQPVPGAEVEVVGDLTPGDAALRGETDPLGICIFHGARCREATVVVRAPDGRAGVGYQYPGQSSHDPLLVEIVLGEGGDLFGVLRLPDGAGLGDGLRVVAMLGKSSTPFARQHSVVFETPVTSSSYRFVDLPDGVYTMNVRGVDAEHLHLCSVGSAGLPEVQPTDGWIEPLTAKVRAGGSVRCDLVLAPAATILGRVTDSYGASIVGATVRCERLLRDGRAWNEGQILGVPVEGAQRTTGQMHPYYERSTRSDAGGDYRIAGLVPGPYRLTVEVAGHNQEIDSDLLVVGGRERRRDFEVVRAGAIEGIVGHSAVVVLWSVDATDKRVLTTDDAGIFHIEGVAVGRYHIGVVERLELARQQLTMTQAPTPLAEVEVRTDQSSFIDLRESLPVRIRGQILGSVGPFSGTRLALLGRRTKTDRDGRFEFGFADPIRGVERILVFEGGVTMGILLPEEARGARDWTGRLELATLPTRLVTSTTDGLPTSAEIELSGAALGRVVTDPRTGRLELSLPRGDLFAQVEFANGVRQERLFRAGETVECVAPLAASVRVLVTDVANQPVRGLKVMASTWVEEGPPPADWGAEAAGTEGTLSVSSVTDTRGRVLLRGVRVGEVVVHLVPMLGRTGALPSRRMVLDSDQSVDVFLTIQ